MGYMFDVMHCKITSNTTNKQQTTNTIISLYFMVAEIKTHTYKNGFTFVHEKPTITSPVTSIHAFVNLGSAFENDTIRGGSHFIEHMCFKGTKKIPKSKDLFIKFDSIGAYFNAYTNKRTTCYKVKTQDDYICNCLMILSDMILNSVFSKKEFFKEEKVVIEENMKNNDDPLYIIEDIIQDLIYKGSSYSYTVDHLKYHKKSFDYKEIIKMYHTFYQPNNVVLSVVSNYSFEQIKRMISKTYFMKKNNVCNECHNLLPCTPHNSFLLNYNITPQNTILYDFTPKKKMTTTHVNISFRTCNHISKDMYVLNMLKFILSGSISSRLFTLLREDNGLTYTSNVVTEYFEHMGCFIITTEIDQTKLMKNGKKPGLFPLIFHLLNELLEKGVNENELKITKNNLKGKEILKLSDIDNQAEYNGYQYLMHHEICTRYSKMYEKHYENVDVNNINNVIKMYIKKQNMSVCCYGGKLNDENAIKRVCETLKQ